MNSLPLTQSTKIFDHISETTLSQMLQQMIPAGADDADLYLQHSISESVSLEEGRVKHVSASTHQGIGARVIMGEASGHAYTVSFARCCESWQSDCQQRQRGHTTCDSSTTSFKT